MFIRIGVLSFLIFFSCGYIFAQDDLINFDAAKLKKFQAFDFSKKKLTAKDISGLELPELTIMRGIVFGKRGRIFKEKSIQNYLVKQSWYKPKENFSNTALTPVERTNLDLIRLAEAEQHYQIEAGDLRLWQNKEIPADKIPTGISAAEWRILVAEFEAIHGKTFSDEEWLQKYFDERYWYKPNPNYSPTVLNEFERKNLQALIEAKDKENNIGLSVGEMDKFQNAPLTPELLKNVSLGNLRLMRNEFYARNGKKFTTAAYKQAYEWQDWYKPLKDQSKVKLNPIEEANVKLIENTETAIREKVSTELLEQDKISDMFAEDLRNLRNEIFARHGRIFKSKDLQKYFEAQSWYRPNPAFKDDMLSEIEYRNITLIKEVETTASSKFVLVEG